MSTLKVQLEDTDGNIYYLTTDANNVFCTDGTSVQAKLDAKINTSNIIQNTATNDGSKVPSSAVTANLQTQITSLLNDVNTKSKSIFNGFKYSDQQWQLEKKSVYLFTVATLGYGKIYDNLMAVYIIFTADNTSGSTTNIYDYYVLPLFEGKECSNTKIGLSDTGILTYKSDYKYCMFSLTRL